MVELINITKSYSLPGQAGEQVLRKIDLKIEKGDSVAILGPSGSGKSTLLNIIGSLDSPSSGTVKFNGRDLAELDDKELSDMRNSQIGFIFQLHYLLPQCTVLENVLIPTLAKKRTQEAEQARQRAMELLQVVGLQGKIDHKPGELSGGERQRAAVARALINEPGLLLADEPTGSLDRENSENIAELLVRLNRDYGVTLIVVTHSEHLAGRMARTMKLSDGLLEDVRL